MKIKFLGIGNDLKKELFEKLSKNENELYVFGNGATYFEFKKDYKEQSKNLFEKFTLLNEYDFYEKILKTNKIVIKEEKQVMFFFNALTDKIKKELNVKSYYDVVDISYNFYTLLAELQEYKVDVNSIKLEEWQKEIFSTILEMKDEMTKKSNELGLVMPYMLRSVENISFDFINKYKKIILVNKVKITPFEKELFEVLENHGIEIEHILQLDEKDYDIENMKIKESFGLPSIEKIKEKGIEIEINQYENKLSQLIGLVKKLENDNDIKYKIYDGQTVTKESEKDYQLLNQQKIEYNNEKTLENTKVYGVLNALCEILGNISKESQSNLSFGMSSLHSAFKLKEFLHTFNVNKKVYNYLQDLARDGYKTVSIKMLDNLKAKEENEKKVQVMNDFIQFLTEIEKIYAIKDLTQYREILENKVDKLFENTKIRDKYFEALSEIVVIEDFSFKNLWTGYFDGSIAEGLLKMFLKYLDKKAIKLILEESEEDKSEKNKINQFSVISELKNENIILLNLQESFPNVKVNNYLLTKLQRKEIGLPMVEDIKMIENFKFINSLFNSKNVILNYVRNLDAKEDCAGIVEEIRLQYGIEIKVSNINESTELEFIKKYFTEKGKEFEKKEIGEFIKSKLMKDNKKLKENNFSLSYYILEKIKNFEYGYYLEKMIGDVENEEIKDEIDALLFGNLIHDIYEEIVKNNKEKIENKLYEVDENEISEILSLIFKKNKYKIPEEYIDFYKEISFNEIVEAVKIFFKDLYELEEIKKVDKFEIYSEKSLNQKIEDISKKYENVTARGRMDLYIKAGEHELLLDYKSGKLRKKDGKLDNDKVIDAQKQLDLYSIILGGVDTRSKYVVNAWNGELIKDKRDEKRKKDVDEDRKDKLTLNDVEEILQKYFETESYDIESKNSDYNYKKYVDIVRKEDEIDGK